MGNWSPAALVPLPGSGNFWRGGIRIVSPYEDQILVVNVPQSVAGGLLVVKIGNLRVPGPAAEVTAGQTP
jgi:hypothetical protein